MRGRVMDEDEHDDIGQGCSGSLTPKSGFANLGESGK
jgi:hypothetical protein